MHNASKDLPDLTEKAIPLKTPLFCSIFIQKYFPCLGAVDVEPPVADEVLLVEDGSIGAEEAVLGKSASTIVPADVERLALCLRVGVVAFSKGGIVECVLSWGSGL